MTQDQVPKLVKDIIIECATYGKICTFEIQQSNQMFARGNPYNHITFSSELINKLTYPQVRSVAYHEIGHIVYEHAKLRAKPIYNRDENFVMIKQQELDADEFSTRTDLKYNQTPQLMNALYIIAPPERYNKDSSTHPSVYKRGINVNRILKEIKH